MRHVSRLIRGIKHGALIPLALAALACGSNAPDTPESSAAPTEAAPRPSSESLEMAIEVYRAQGCAICHGEPPLKKALAGPDLVALKAGALYLKEAGGEQAALEQMMDYIKNAREREPLGPRDKSYSLPMQSLTAAGDEDLKLLAQLMLSYR